MIGGSKLRGARLASAAVSLVVMIFSVLTAVPAGAHAQEAEATTAQQLWVTMHTAPIDDYCAPCIASEKLLKQHQVEFKKVLEPLGPWPWFLLTDSSGNQKRIRGALSKEDVLTIKRGEFPKR